MSSVHKNLDVFSPLVTGDYSKFKIAIITSEWNEEITESLRNGAYSSLIENGILPNNIVQKSVPGSYELVFGAAREAAKSNIDAVICLGCVIQGETRHFDFICHAVAQGLVQVSIKYHKPVIFGVLTPDNQQQAIDRAGGKHGNKGIEAGITALKMLANS